MLTFKFDFWIRIRIGCERGIDAHKFRRCCGNWNPPQAVEVGSITFSQS